ncbi:MAG: methyltransferase [Bacteroidota bacterium]
MSGIFNFKQFKVDQSGCAMKINTDGVLLAALVESDKPDHILDVGTGTGIIALMLAQRFSDACITAVEIDSAAAATAGRNFKDSTFNSRLSITNMAIEQYHSAKQFDLIVANPPYFVNDLKSTEKWKGIARHAGDQFFKDLIAKVNDLLVDNGSFWFILPVKQAEFLIKEAALHGFIVAKHILLHSDLSKPAFRWIICLNRLKTETDIVHFYIYEREKVYTEAYRTLLKDFFLGY